MTTSVVSPPQARARGVEFVPDALVVHLEDGRSLTVPLEWFPRCVPSPGNSAACIVGIDQPAVPTKTALTA